MQWLDPVPAPIKKGDQLGTFTLEMSGETRNLALHAGQDVEVLGMFERVSAAIKYLIFGAPVIPSVGKVKVMMRGLFITFEGGEGSGKTTQIQRLKIWIEKCLRRLFFMFLRVNPVVLKVLRRFGRCYLNGVTQKWQPATEAMLMSASRHEHFVHVISAGPAERQYCNL